MITMKITITKNPLSATETNYPYHRVDPDTFINITNDMPDYMQMLAGADECLSGLPADEVWLREIRTLKADPDLGPEKLRVSKHGWLRLAECAVWGQRCGVPYALGLKTLWTWRKDSDVCDWFRNTWPNLF